MRKINLTKGLALVLAGITLVTGFDTSVVEAASKNNPNRVITMKEFNTMLQKATGIKEDFTNLPWYYQTESAGGEAECTDEECPVLVKAFEDGDNYLGYAWHRKELFKNCPEGHCHIIGHYKKENGVWKHKTGPYDFYSLSEDQQKQLRPAWIVNVNHHKDINGKYLDKYRKNIEYEIKPLHYAPYKINTKDFTRYEAFAMAGYAALLADGEDPAETITAGKLGLTTYYWYGYTHDFSGGLDNYQQIMPDYYNAPYAAVAHNRAIADLPERKDFYGDNNHIANTIINWWNFPVNLDLEEWIPGYCTTLKKNAKTALGVFTGATFNKKLYDELKDKGRISGSVKEYKADSEKILKLYKRNVKVGIMNDYVCIMYAKGLNVGVYDKKAHYGAERQQRYLALKDKLTYGVAKDLCNKIANKKLRFNHFRKTRDYAMLVEKKYKNYKDK